MPDHQAFASRYADGDALIYRIESGTMFEIGIGEFVQQGNLIRRLTVLRSTNRGRKVAFSGTCRIYPTTMPQRGYLRMIPMGETVAVLSQRLKLGLKLARRDKAARKTADPRRLNRPGSRARS